MHGTRPSARTRGLGAVVERPYGPFFVLGALLAWAGVLHWLLYATGVTDRGHPIFHAIVQIQGFMMCFAAGFLFTAIPRRTGTTGPRRWQVGLGLACPIGVTAAAWFQRWSLAQFCWLALVVLLITFVVARFRRAAAAGRPPGSFVWVPLSLLMGVVGSVLIGVYGVLGSEWFLWHQVGRTLLLQGMFLGLVLGIGSMLLPRITRNDVSGGAGRPGLAGFLPHVLGALALAGSLVVAVHEPRLGFALTALVLLVFLIRNAAIHRPPSVPGAHRRLVWLSAWMLPLGYALAAASPYHWQAGLHVVFLGGFALMAFSVAVHVTLAHGGREDLERSSPWQVLVYGALFLVALAARVTAQFRLEEFTTWIGIAAACFLAGTLVWASLVVPVLLQRPRPSP